MITWGYPSIHVVVPFSSVMQELCTILGSKPPYLCREVSLESLYQICRATEPQSQKWWFSTPPVVKLKLDKWLHRKKNTYSYSCVYCLFHVILSISNPVLVIIGKNLFILAPAVFSGINPHGHIVKEISMTKLFWKRLGTGNFSFYTRQYWLCNIDYPVILTQKSRDGRIVIPGRECTFSLYQ